MPDKAGNKPRPVGLDQMAFFQDAEIAQDGAVESRHHGFACARRPGEDHVQGDGRHRQAALASRRFDPQTGDQHLDLRFDRAQAGHPAQFLERAEAVGDCGGFRGDGGLDI